jgi:hypothetical protein
MQAILLYVDHAASIQPSAFLKSHGHELPRHYIGTHYMAHAFGCCARKHADVARLQLATALCFMSDARPQKLAALTRGDVELEQTGAPKERGLVEVLLLACSEQYDMCAASHLLDHCEAVQVCVHACMLHCPCCIHNALAQLVLHTNSVIRTPLLHSTPHAIAPVFREMCNGEQACVTMLNAHYGVCKVHAYVVQA